MAIADPAASVRDPGRLPLLGQMLVERGVATEADIAEALARQRERGRRLGECLVELGHVDRAALYRVLAERAGVEFVDLQSRTIDEHVAKLLPEATARHFQAIVIEQHPDHLVVAMANPEDVLELDDLAVITGKDIKPVLADPEELRTVIGRFYATGDIPGSIRDAAHDFADDAPLAGLDDLTDGSIIRLVDALVEQAVMRLVDMGVEPYLTASALTCVVAQRLARRLCAHCATGDEQPDRELLRRYGMSDEMFAGHTIRRAVGCEACHHTGYYGRFAIYEVMLVDDAIRTVILNRGSTGEIERLAVAGGMDTMRAAALKRVADGELTLDELQRVIA